MTAGSSGSLSHVYGSSTVPVGRSRRNERRSAMGGCTGGTLTLGERYPAPRMKVWIDQDLCTGDGLCEEIAPDVFTLLDDGLAYVKEGSTVFAEAKGNKQGADGLANIPDNKLDGVIESAEECPGECIFIEA